MRICHKEKLRIKQTNIIFFGINLKGHAIFGPLGNWHFILNAKQNESTITENISTDFQCKGKTFTIHGMQKSLVLIILLLLKWLYT